MSHEVELPAAEPAFDGPIPGDSNRAAKRRQTIIWGAITALVLAGGGFVIYQMLKPVPSRDNPEAARRILATADLARGQNMSGEAQASELAVRVQELDRQIAELNGQNVQLSAEAQGARQQLEAERADALRTIDALNNQIQTRGSSAPPGPGGVAVNAGGAAPAMQANGVAPAPMGGGDPFAPVGAGAGGQMAPGVAGADSGVRPRRTLSTVRVAGAAGQGGAAGGPTVSTSRTGGGAAGPPAGGTGGTGQGQYMSSSMQVFDTERFVPPNAYTRARVLVGVDAATGVTSGSDPKPVLFRLTGPAIHVGADGRYQRTDLTGCLVNGAAYAELSSEKVYIRLQRISCPAGPRQFSVATVEGYASHLGKAGVRGNVISREGGLTGRAMIAGTLQGLGNSLSRYTDQMSSSIGIGAGGSLTAPPRLEAGDVAAGAAGSGVANAAEMLADYYVKRAEQYQPVVEMPTGIEVELVFLSGFEIGGPTRR